MELFSSAGAAWHRRMKAARETDTGFFLFVSVRDLLCFGTGATFLPLSGGCLYTISISALFFWMDFGIPFCINLTVLHHRPLAMAEKGS